MSNEGGTDGRSRHESFEIKLKLRSKTIDKQEHTQFQEKLSMSLL
ncbi:hypothetical protein CKA32_005828 [Geitlerinema sp. FC II]|nr:hypothetical protein CKA32_005828 [Geitlerinema sp. FC II]